MRYSYLWLASLPLATACTRDAPTPPAVSASFTTAAPAEARRPLSFQNTSQNATSYVWNFGDGITAKTANPVHTYTKIGTYQVTLRAYGTQQDSASTTQSVVVGEYNILQHTTAKIVGTYDYKLYRYTAIYPPYTDPSTYTFEGTGVMTVVQTSPSTFLITTPNFTTKATYLASDPNISFDTDLYEGAMAYFYTAGDSLLLTRLSHLAHYSHSTDYYRSRRRP
jgi:PKD repeat protein